MDFPFTWCLFWPQLSEWRLKLLQQSSHGLPVASLGCIRQQSGRLGQDLTFKAAKLFEVRQVWKRRWHRVWGYFSLAFYRFFWWRKFQAISYWLPLGNFPPPKIGAGLLLFLFGGETKIELQTLIHSSCVHSCIHICCIVWHFPSS